MLRRIKLFICASLFCSPLWAADLSQSQPDKMEHVIYITLDGVRWQDVYLDHQYFPSIWNDYVNELTFYGAPDSKTTMEVASTPISLPSYQSQMSGAVQPCLDNACGRIKVQTFPEKLVTEYGFKKKDMVMFASWVPMQDSFQSVDGIAYANAGNVDVVDPETGVADSVMHELNMRQRAYHPQKGDRYDIYTAEQAIHYFLTYQPAFMWLSLAGSDNAAHLNDLSGYHASLRLYDNLLAELFALLKQKQLADKTVVIVTTDHGRGDGSNWTNHGPQLPESKQTFAFVWHGSLHPVSEQGEIKHYSTLSIRPTIEGYLKKSVG